MKCFLGKRTALYVILLSLTGSFLLFFLCYRYDNKYTGNAVQPINGILFLNEEELLRHPIHFLVNEWAAYDDVLLSPKDFHNSPAPIPDRYMQIGTGPDTVRTGRATYSLMLVLPPVRAAYTLEIPEIYSSYSLYVGDSLLVSQSIPQSGRYTDRLQTGSITFSASGDTRILLAVENRNYYYGGILSPPALGKPIAVSALITRQLVFHTLLLSIAGFLALFFFLPGIYTLQPRRYLFAGLCLMFIGYSYYNVRSIYPYSPFLSTSVELFCYYGMFLFILLLTGSLYNKKSLFMQSILCLSCGICILAACIPYLGRYAKWISEFLNLYKLLMAAVFLIYAAAAALRGNVRHKSLLTGISFFTASLIADQIWPLFEPIYFGWFPELAGSCFILILAAILLLESQQLKRSQLQLEQQIVRQEQHYETLSEQIEHTKKARHDLRHHITILHQMLMDNRVPEALDYLKEYEGTFSLSEKMIFTDHYKIDVIIRYFYTLAHDNGISVTINTPLPRKLFIPETNLCIIFANLLENALESCQKSNDKTKFIRLNTTLIRSQIVITMENTLGTLPIPSKDGFMSTKKEGRKGIGLSSIQNIAQNYGGDARFEVLNASVFSSQVLLINQEPAMDK